MSPEGITGLKEDLYGLDLPPMINVSGTDRYLELFKPSYEVFLSGKNNRQFALKSYVLQILRMIFEEASLDGSAGRRTRSLTTNYPKIQKVKALIESSPDSRLTLEQLASVAELSPNFLCRIFREIEGEPPVTYINRCRINQAKKLLVETGKPVKEICYLCGFENSSYFFEVFRRFEGTTPLAFRYRHRIFSQQSPEGRQS